jgi:DNA-binding response OmpR family regulator
MSQLRLRKNILIVDDDDLTIKSLSLRLLQEGLNVMAVKDANQAIGLIFNQMDLDLVLLDLMLPKVSGLELFKIIRNHYDQKVPIIIISSINNSEVILHSMIQGAEDYFIKPLNVDELLSKIKTLLYKRVIDN